MRRVVSALALCAMLACWSGAVGRISPPHEPENRWTLHTLPLSQAPIRYGSSARLLLPDILASTTINLIAWPTMETPRWPASVRAALDESRGLLHSELIDLQMPSRDAIPLPENVSLDPTLVQAVVPR